MTQQEGIMQDVNTFAGTGQCQLPEYDHYSEDSDQTGQMPRQGVQSLGVQSFCWFCHEAAQISIAGLLLLQRKEQ